jgi:transcriptional regulator with XRE-family HTH domain
MAKAQSQPFKTDSEGFGEFLKTAREAQGLSVRQLAALVESAPSQVLRWEREEHLPKAAMLARLSAVLQVRDRDLYLAAGVPVPRGTPSLPAMLRREYDVPPEAIAEMQRSIERVARKYANQKSTGQEPERKEGI